MINIEPTNSQSQNPLNDVPAPGVPPAVPTPDPTPAPVGPEPEAPATPAADAPQVPSPAAGESAPDTNQGGQDGEVPPLATPTV